MPGLDEDGRRKATKRGKSASGEFDEPEGRPAPTFVEVADGEDEFEPVDEDAPAVVWEDEEDRRLMESRWEDLLEDLFGDELAIFKEVEREVKWAPGEVIWEGMDFEQIFGDADEFRAFELMSALEKKKFLRNKLREHQASSAADAGDLELDATMRRKARARKEPAIQHPARPHGPSTTVSYGTEGERTPEDLDSLGGDRHRHHRRTKG